MEKDKRLLMIPVFGVIIVATVFIMYSPSNLLPMTMETVEVTGVGLHLADGSNVLLLVSMSVENPSSVPVTITDVDIELLVNGAFYGSLVLGGGEQDVLPGETVSIVRIVQLIGSPIGFQSEGTTEQYMLDISADVTGEASSLGLWASRTVTVERMMSWYYDRS
ncbi:MAG: hypothetical protein NWF07_14265 [Candidatus Bathyarchaeota archaeon]|nr:hypothetical protein [Candidatus Bathyarchaeota archaeon]